MARRPFRKFHTKDHADAIQVTKENIEEVRNAVNGQITDDLNTEGQDTVLWIPGIPVALQAKIGDFVIDAKGGYQVMVEEDFREFYRVPKQAPDGTEAEEDEDDEE